MPRDEKKAFGCIPAGVKLVAKEDTEVQKLETALYQDLFKGVAALKFLPILEWLPLGLRFFHYPKTLDLADNNPSWPSILDQGNLGSCVDNSVSTCLSVVETKETNQVFQASRLFLYWNSRLPFEKGNDTGSTLGACALGARLFGAPQEQLWPYDVNKFAVKPPQAAWDDGTKHKVTKSFYTLTLGEILHSLNKGYPVAFCFWMFQSFASMSDANGWVCPIPTDTDPCIGGHCVTIRGYDLAKKLFLIQNSWGKAWGAVAQGKPGCCWLPFDYVCSIILANGWRTFRKVQNS